MQLIKNLSRMIPLMALAVCGTANGADPSVYVPNYGKGEMIHKMSDNGKYVVMASKGAESDNYDSNARRVDITTKEMVSLEVENSWAGVSDVSDSGLVTGTFNGHAAVWTDKDGWKELPEPAGNWEGSLTAAVTPDGKYAVGRAFNYASAENYGEKPILWNLETMEIIPTTGVTDKNLEMMKSGQVRFTDISADGKKIVGMVDYSYPNSLVSFLYDVDKNESIVLGFNLSSDGKSYIPVEGMDGLFCASEPVISNNGKYVAGDALIVGDNWMEFDCPFRYDVEENTYILFSDSDSQDMRTNAVTNDGVLYGSTPYASPIRDWKVRSGNYWVECSTILRQKYNTTIDKLTGYNDGITGTVFGVSEDGTKLVAMLDPQSGDSYAISFDEKPEVIALGINLLDEYTVTPKAGSKLSFARDFEFRFTREIEIAGAASDICLYDEEGNICRNAIQVDVDESTHKTLTVSFRKYTLNDGVRYNVVIPEGFLNIRGDAEKGNGEIKVVYYGRSEAPVKILEVNPKSGSSVARLNSTTDPINLLFDMEVMGSDNFAAHLDLIEEDGNARLQSALSVMIDGNQATLYPITDQYLFKDNNYRVVIEAGSFTDIQGGSGNEETVINYTGTFVRETGGDATHLFSNDFNDGTWLSQFMFYEGDLNHPTVEMQGWGFQDSDTQFFPWWIVRDSVESEDWALCSHSMYSPAGKSDDWLCLPQLYILDETCALTFKGQSYKKAAEDYLSIYVYESDIVYNELSQGLTSAIREKGDLVFHERLTPGSSEDNLEGDWTEYAVSLKPYTGKNVYIAFVNENDNQSAIFIDDVEVTHAVDFQFSLTTPEIVVAQESVKVGGQVKIDLAGTSLEDIEFQLIDADEKVVDIYNAEGTYGYGDVVEFRFEKALPLVKGVVNKYFISLKSGEYETVYGGSVSNLYFEPVKRVVLEEGTGQGCQNCPMGIVMIEKMKEAYGDKFIPMGLHTYDGDVLGTGLQQYASVLGFAAYPVAIANRRNNSISYEQVFPMKSKAGVSDYVYSDPEDPMWWDVVADEFQKGTILDVDFESEDMSFTTPVYNAESNEIEIPAKVTYAINQEDLNHNLFAVVMEDGVEGYQRNGYGSVESAVLGEWAKGGKYSSSMVYPYYFDHVVRGAIGRTFNGTGDLLPKSATGGVSYKATITAKLPETVDNWEKCSVVLMVIDANTSKVVNSNIGHLSAGSGINSVIGNDEVKVNCQNGTIIVKCDGEAYVQAFSADGKLLGTANGQGILQIPASSYSGVAIVHTVTQGTSVISKVMCK